MFLLRAYLGTLALLLLCVTAAAISRPGECAVAALAFAYLLSDARAETRALDRAEAALAAWEQTVAEVQP